MKSKTTKAKKVITELVWIDIAKTKTPSDAIVYGFVSPDLIPFINQLANVSSHSVVIGGSRFDNSDEVCESVLARSTKWEEQS